MQTVCLPQAIPLTLTKRPQKSWKKPVQVPQNMVSLRPAMYFLRGSKLSIASMALLIFGALW